MKKIKAVKVLFVITLISGIASATNIPENKNTGVLLPKPKIYVSIGGTYGWNLNVEKSPAIDLRSWGYDMRLGMEFGSAPTLSIEIERTRLPSFERNTRNTHSNGDIEESKSNMDLGATMINLKIGYPLTIERIKIAPYLIAGIGEMKMTFNADATRYKVNGPEATCVEYDWNKTTCYRIGGGMNIPIYKENVYLLTEVSYWWYKIKEIGNQKFYFSTATMGLGYKF
jgi:opacity protein-like surface antigen